MQLHAGEERKKPRNLKQVQNVAVREGNGSSSGAVTSGKANLADDIQSLCTNVTTSDFVQGVYLIKGHAPSVILYTQEEISDIHHLLPRDAMHKRGYCWHAVSVRPPVCLSVTFVSCAKTNKYIFEIFSPSGSQAILVFPYRTGWRYSDGKPPNEGIKCKGV